MFSLLVSADGEHWEGTRLTMDLGRFKEYSGAEADAIAADKPSSLRRLEDHPALLMYEVGAGGPNERLVRHGRLRNVVVNGHQIVFGFEPDRLKGYLDRSEMLRFADLLGMHSFEQSRTHWAVKDGDLPSGLLEKALAERPARTVAVVAAEYIEARRERQGRTVASLEEELASFPPSLEKALALLPARLLGSATPEVYPILGVKPKTPEGRAALDAVLARDASGANLPMDWEFSVAWFLERYGSPTDSARREQAIRACAQHMIALGATGGKAKSHPAVEELSSTLWRCARSLLLARSLRREVAVLIDRLVRRQEHEGFWSDASGRRSGTANMRGTALATVALQRLGDDRHHEAIGRAVKWLISQLRPDGAIARRTGDKVPDILATTLTMEAIRRSDLATAIPHVLLAGDAWIVSGQTVLGGWVAEPWPDDFVAAVVLEYLERRGAMLPQVDGFLLMARDFFRKAEELRLEGGANNRRLSAIATVHAVEMFLYGMFERREDLALSAFTESGVETLGPRAALKGLQDSLQRLGLLVAPRRLGHRDQISSLIGRRDGIIHRAHEISESELDDGLMHARKFIEQYGAELLGLDLLQ